MGILGDESDFVNDIEWAVSVVTDIFDNEPVYVNDDEVRRREEERDEWNAQVDAQYKKSLENSRSGLYVPAPPRKRIKVCREYTKEEIRQFKREDRKRAVKDFFYCIGALLALSCCLAYLYVSFFLR